MRYATGTGNESLNSHTLAWVIAVAAYFHSPVYVQSYRKSRELDLAMDLELTTRRPLKQPLTLSPRVCNGGDVSAKSDPFSVIKQFFKETLRIWEKEETPNTPATIATSSCRSGDARPFWGGLTHGCTEVRHLTASIHSEV